MDETTKQDDASPNLESLYKLIREQIQHEDNLVNQRLTWLLGIEAFLFAGFAALSAVQNPTDLQKRLPFCVAILGGIFALLSIFSIDAAFRSLKRLRDCWHDHPKHITFENDATKEWVEKYACKSGFPPSTYVGGPISKAGTSAYGTPAFIVLVWLILCFFQWQSSSDNLKKAEASIQTPVVTTKIITTVETSSAPEVRPTSSATESRKPDPSVSPSVTGPPR